MKRIVAGIALALLVAVGATAPARAFVGVSPEELREQAEAGDAEAQARLGVLHAQGIGMERDFAEALRWYRLAAAQGNALGQYNLAFLYVRGEGVAQDLAKARELLQSAAGKGMAEAQFDLGYMLVEGIGGGADREAGEAWLRRSAAQGYPEALEAVKALDGD